MGLPHHQIALMYYIYVIQNVNDETDFYLGYSADLRKRLDQHNSGMNASTKGRTWRIAYYEAYQVKEFARAREAKLKRNKRMRQMLMQRVREQFGGEGSS